MKQQLERFLQRKEYGIITSNLQEFTIYFKTEHNFVNVIFVIEDKDGLYITKEQYDHIKEKAIVLFQEKGIFNIHILSLILSTELEKAKRIAEEDPFCWIIDTDRKSLIIYENKVSDFYGMKKELEDWLFSYDEIKEETASEYGERGFERKTRQEVMQGWKSNAYVNAILLGMNTITFLICTFTGNLLYNIGALESSKILEKGQWYRFFTAMFLHADINHLLSNMMLLFFAGSMVEKTIGHFKYGLIYMIAGLGGGMASFFSQILTRQYGASLGASGAIFGIIGALLFQVLLHRGRLQYVTTGKMLFLIFYSLYSGFVATNVDNAAHIGGLFTGFVVMLILSGLEKLQKQKDRSRI